MPHMKSILRFNQGLMLLYQFIDLVINIHEKGMNFGYLDFQNFYFIQNNHTHNASKYKTPDRNNTVSKVKNYFSYELLFIEKNLQILTVNENMFFCLEISGYKIMI